MEVYQFFQDEGWLVYFEKLNGFNKQITMKFSNNLQEGRSIVRVIVILVTKETIYNVTGLDPIGERCFVRRIPSLEQEAKEGEVLHKKGKFNS